MDPLKKMTVEWGGGAGGSTLMVSLTVKYLFFLATSLT